VLENVLKVIATQVGKATTEFEKMNFRAIYNYMSEADTHKTLMKSALRAYTEECKLFGAINRILHE
jgi:hypothetical protein